MKKIFIIVALVAGLMVSAQVKIGDDVGNINANSILELESTAANKGVLFPKVALTSTPSFAPLTGVTGVQIDATGMTVYNTVTTGDVTPGMYTWSGAAWVRLGSSTPAYQNIGGGVETFTTNGTISDNTYFVLFTGSVSSTLNTPTAVAGKTLVVRNTGSGTVLIAGLTVGTGKGRTFVCDGTTWYILIP